MTVRGSPIIACRLPEPLQTRVQAHCAARRVKITDLIRAALTRHLDALEPPK